MPLIPLGHSSSSGLQQQPYQKTNPVAMPTTKSDHLNIWKHWQEIPAVLIIKPRVKIAKNATNANTPNIIAPFKIVFYMIKYI
jgi:hypothetical protein